MSIGTYLYYNGNCREAVDFYTEAFKTDKPKILTYGEAPGGGAMPEALKKNVIHAELTVAGDTLMLSDAMPDSPITFGNNVGIMVGLETPDMLRAVFDRLKAGGEVIMDVQETFFSTCYAYIVDKFGVSWQLNVKSIKD